MEQVSIKFGIPSQRSKKEKVEFLPDYPIMTVCKDGGKGTSKMILFNRKGLELLSEEGLTPAQISFSFYENPPLICNTSELSLPDTKAHDMYENKEYHGAYIRNQKTWKYIIDKYILSKEDDNHFILSQANVEGISKAVSFEPYEEVKDYSEASTEESTTEDSTITYQEQY